MLWIRVTNPATGNRLPPVLAIIDTGADDCAFPAEVATVLGHNLESVAPKDVRTAGGDTKAYAHTSCVEILETLANGLPGKKVLYTISDTPIDFIKGCKDFLLGKRKFLSRFVVTFDFPRQRFSIRKPHRKRSKR